MIPKSTRAWGDTLLPTLIIAAAIALVAAICLILLYAPNEQTLGFVQRIFYFHVPSAILGYLGFTICFCASILYLFRGGAHIDAVARVGAPGSRIVVHRGRVGAARVGAAAVVHLSPAVVVTGV